MKLTYIAICSQNSNPGVLKKIYDWVDASKELGFESKALIISPSGGILTYLKFNLEIIRSKNEILMIRNPTHLRFLLFFSLLIARINSCRIIIDVPSPIYVLIKEINNRKFSLIKYFTIIELLISSSIPFIFAHKIVQYAHEKLWFRIGCSSKVVYIGNGINVTRIKVRSSQPNWPSDRLVLIGVANVAFWHGFDRILRSISEFNSKDNFSFKIFFDIVGDGPDLVNLKSVVKDYDIQKFVTFHGLVSDSNYIDSLYINSHIAVSSLGLFRIGLESASVLKSREYVASGIPFIFAGEDIDFPENNNFRFRVSNDESVKDIVALFERMNNITFPEPELIREFAFNNLSITSKLKSLVEF